MPNDSPDSGTWLTELSAADLERLTPTERAEWDRLIAPSALDPVRADRAAILTLAGVDPDPWQAEVIRGEGNALMLCSRQSGKSIAAAALALAVAVTEADSLILLLSPSLRQSGELFRAKLLPLHDATRLVPTAGRTQLELTLANGSRVVSLPENEEGIRGFSGVRLLIIDEASRVADATYFACRPMLATSGGRLVALSTPFGRRGWYFDEWTGKAPWQRVKVTALQCPRITREFLETERLALGDRWYAQEYLCSFEEAVGAVFSSADIAAAVTNDVQPLFPIEAPNASRWVRPRPSR